MSTWISRAAKALRRMQELAQREDTQAKIARERRIAYERHLRSDYWRDLRIRALRRADHRCEWVTRGGNRCRCTEYLQVHHLHYDTFGHEELRDVQVLCEKHHTIADRRRREEYHQRARRKARNRERRR